MDKTVWYFINSEEQREKIFVVGIESARNVVALMSKSEHNKWYVRNREKEILTRVSECVEFRDINQHTKLINPKIPKSVRLGSKLTKTIPIKAEVEDRTQPDFEIKKAQRTQSKLSEFNPEASVTNYPYDPSTNTVEQAMSPPIMPSPSTNGAKSQRRKNKRVIGKLKVLVFVDKKVFRTHTRNISIGGLYLDKSFPSELAGKKCRVVIASKTNHMNIEFDAELSGIEKDGTRIIFGRDPKIESYNQLTTWIESMELPNMEVRVAQVNRAA